MQTIRLMNIRFKMFWKNFQVLAILLLNFFSPRLPPARTLKADRPNGQIPEINIYDGVAFS